MRRFKVSDRVSMAVLLFCSSGALVAMSGLLYESQINGVDLQKETRENMQKFSIIKDKR
jgi:hypothetical protein